MRSFPKPEDQEELDRLHAEDWQINLLRLNPEYVYWGCFEDYMCSDKGGWSSRIITPTWKDHSDWSLDNLNECVNFYFEIYRKNHECPHCEGSGENPETHQLSKDWYDFDRTGRRWSNKIGEVEIEALVKRGRLSDLNNFHGHYDEEDECWYKWENGEKVKCEKPDFPTPEEVNEWSEKGFGHDAINKWICVKARAKHLGIYGKCDECEGLGVLYDEDKARVALQLWYLHPRKGCSRGVYIESIEQEDLPEIVEYLKKAAKRNTDRFSGLKKFKKNEYNKEVDSSR